MKRVIFLPFSVICWFCCLQPTMAQIGIKAGAGFSEIGFKDEGQSPFLGYEMDYLVHRLPAFSYQAGAFGTFGIGKKFAFQPELLYARKGLDYSDEFIFDDITYKLHINYLHVPVLLKYKGAPHKQLHPGFILGPYGSVKLKATRITEIEGIKEKVSMPNVKHSDWGLIAGFSLEVDRPSGPLSFDFRMSYSLVNMMGHVEGYIPWYMGPSTAYARNINMSLTVGYAFVNLRPKNDKGK